jgi:hypothetical protein
MKTTVALVVLTIVVVAFLILAVLAGVRPPLIASPLPMLAGASV